MKYRPGCLFSLLFLTMLSCNAAGSGQMPTVTRIPSTEPSIPFPPPATLTRRPTSTSTSTPLPTETTTASAIPVADSLDAKVTADLLSCRYGPGPEYLYLFALRAGANIELIGRVDTDNWEWVLVENQVPCWVNANFLEVAGDIKSLPHMYPEGVKLPVTPYYPPTAVLSATRNPTQDEITVSWMEIPVSQGDYEDDSMQTYIVEVWRCESGQLIFDPLATRFPFITFVDEPGCAEPSHGRVFVQEKHGYAGPAEIPWPE